MPVSSNMALFRGKEKQTLMALIYVNLKDNLFFKYKKI